MKSRTLGTLLVASALVATLAVSSVSSDDAAKKEFTLVYNVNNSGYVDVCGCKHKEVRQGSLTRRSSFLKQLRATGRKLMLLDGGSTLFHISDRVKEAERVEAIRKAHVIVDGYNHMGYEAMAVGAYDLAAGLDTLLDLEKRAKFQMLSANLANKKTGKLFFKPHTIIEKAGVRVGVIGLTLNTLTKVFLGKVAPDAKLLEPIAAARKSVEELKGKTDLIIALAHLREETNDQLIKELKQLSILVDPYIQYGNHHTWIKEHEWVAEKGHTLVLRSDGQGARLGIVDIRMLEKHPKLLSQNRVDELAEAVEYDEATPDEKKELAVLQKGSNFYQFTRLSLEPHHLTDPYVDQLVKAWKDKIDPTKLKLDPAKKKHYVTHDKCQSCHQEQYKFWKGTKHASAYASLKETGDHHRFDCVGCHALGYGQSFVNTKEIGNYADVQCENCHGNQPNHVKEPAAHPYGKVKRLNCITCHNKEQTKKTFNYFRAKRLVACPSMKKPTK